MFQALFGVKQKTPQEMVKDWDKQLRAEQRKLDRQVRGIELQEAKVVKEAKAAAKKGDKEVVQILAKQIVGSKRAKKRIVIAKAQMNSISLQLKQQLAQVKIAGAMQKSAEITGKMNSLLKVQDCQEVMRALQMEMLKAGVIQETMDEAIDDALGDEDLEDEADAEVAKIVDEVMMATLGNKAAGGAQALPQQQAEEPMEEEQDDLQKRLAALRGDG
eukprot:TRINITY_DN18725_c0_g2_i1.p1 TRINITY_DN18725_c0_g2~~TRINITY_DN18725_c0_g2_i1.p1  ORF type:complete len:217 (+),score=125.23 TRINITY_DN18725_c0_g2_i1:92-742(+)